VRKGKKRNFSFCIAVKRFAHLENIRDNFIHDSKEDDGLNLQYGSDISVIRIERPLFPTSKIYSIGYK